MIYGLSNSLYFALSCYLFHLFLCLICINNCFSGFIFYKIYLDFSAQQSYRFFVARRIQQIISLFVKLEIIFVDGSHICAFLGCLFSFMDVVVRCGRCPCFFVICVFELHSWYNELYCAFGLYQWQFQRKKHQNQEET